VAGHLAVGRRQPAAWHGLLVGIVAALVPLAALARLPPEIMVPMLINIGLPQAILNIAATGLASLMFVQAKRLSAERDLLAAALAQAPDFHYIKDRQSRFAAVNNAVAELNGFAHPADIIGKTDFDLTSADRAKALFDR
jgi:PAS domain-containing protein